MNLNYDVDNELKILNLSLKNCKLTCSQWREFIDRRIWGSKSALKQLNIKRNSLWKSEKPNM